jgi:hypothetical protein
MWTATDVLAILVGVLLFPLVILLGSTSPTSTATAATTTSAATFASSRVNSIVCEKRYINNAWGFQHNGVYVDNLGHVYRFDASDEKTTHSYDSADEQAVTTLAKLQRHHLGKRRKLVKTLTPAELDLFHEMVAHVQKEDAGLGPQIGYGNDGGATTYNCYVADGNGENAPMTKYELRLDGNDMHDGAGPHARRLADWLTELDRATR